MVGRAVDSLATLEPSPPFDLVFIDADKPSNLDYFIHAKRLLRPGGVIVSAVFFLALYYRFRSHFNSLSGQHLRPALERSGPL